MLWLKGNSGQVKEKGIIKIQINILASPRGEKWNTKKTPMKDIEENMNKWKNIILPEDLLFQINSL